MNAAVIQNPHLWNLAAHLTLYREIESLVIEWFQSPVPMLSVMAQ